MPEALRTERYSIQKLAIEKNFRGDSSTGIVIEHPERHSLAITAQGSAKEGGSNRG
jgi:hypothetical protein